MSPLRVPRPHLPSNVERNGYFEHSVTQITTFQELNAIRHEHPANILHPVATPGQRPLTQSGSDPAGFYTKLWNTSRATCVEKRELLDECTYQLSASLQHRRQTHEASYLPLAQLGSHEAQAGWQTNRNYVTGKSPRISRPTRPAGWLACWLAGVALLMGQQLAFGIEERKQKKDKLTCSSKCRIMS